MGETPKSCQLLVGSSSSANSMDPGRRRPDDRSYLRKVQFWLIRCQPFTGDQQRIGRRRSDLEAPKIRERIDSRNPDWSLADYTAKPELGSIVSTLGGVDAIEDNNSVVLPDIDQDDDSSVDTTMYIMSNRKRLPATSRTHRRPTNLLKQCWLMQPTVRCSPLPSGAAADTAEAEAAGAGAVTASGTGQVAEISSTQPTIGGRRGRKRKQPISCSQRNARRRKLVRRMSSSSSSSVSSGAGN